MSVVLDASALIALQVRRDPHHEAAREAYLRTDDELVTTPLVLAEMEFVLVRRGTRRMAEVLYRNIEDGAFTIRWWADAIFESIRIAREHPELGLADASLVALADRTRTDRIFTFDRHFDGLATPGGRTLKTVPERT